MGNLTIKGKVYLAWTSSLRRKSKVHGGRSFCFPAVQNHYYKCNKCCLFCMKICEKPKCWSLKTLKHCLFKCTSTDIMWVAIDPHFKPKYYWKEMEKGGII